MTWREDMQQVPEWTKIVWELVPYTRGKGLDLGCGTQKAFPHFLGIDSKKDRELFGVTARPDIEMDATDLSMFADGGLDFVFSSHLLEHIEAYQATLREWWRVIKPGGNLVLYLPHADFYPQVGEPGANVDHKHNFWPTTIVKAMEGVGSWDLLRSETRGEGDEYSFLQVFKKLPKGSGHKHSYLDPKDTRPRAAVVRYGAWGDGLQGASVLTGLRAQGYHITFYTTPRCLQVLEYDPRIDRFIVQDKDQVPNAFLGQFWDWERAKYDKWVNLSGTVESSWLPDPEIAGDVWHGRSTAVRAKYLNHNYIEFTHDVAEVPYEKPEIKFYPTLAERNKAHEAVVAMKAKPLIMWVLAGSAMHKVWPYIDTVLSRLFLEYPEARVVTVGDPRCQIIENAKPGADPLSLFDWHKEPRIVRMSGGMEIRDTLTLAQMCDLVIGPETGVLSAVSMEPMAKVMFLSHSTHENLSRDWVNTFALFPTKTKCYPCHQLHHTWKHCHESKAYPGIAQCQEDIPADACWEAIQRALGGKVQKVMRLAHAK